MNTTSAVAAAPARTVQPNVPASQEPEAPVEVKAGADVVASQPQPQPLLATSPPSSPSLAQLFSQPLLDAKDRRAYEVARQRAKRPEDRRKARYQKAKHNYGWFASVRIGGRTRATAHAAVEEANDVDGPANKGAKGAVMPESLSKPEVGSNANSRTNMNENVREVVVRLEDLIRVAKVRKEKAGDFELVPRVRAVIALDDTDFSNNGTGAAAKKPDFDADDWEHVESCSSADSSEEEEGRKVPSYAQVVSAMKQ